MVDLPPSFLRFFAILSWPLSTNYYNTFISVAEDCPVNEGTIPPMKPEKKTVAQLQFEMLHDHPYAFDSDEVIFFIYAKRNALEGTIGERETFFSKGQPCFRSSPLTKRYGWGIHSNAEGKIALVPKGSSDYNQFLSDPKITQIKAMRSKRAK